MIKNEKELEDYICNNQKSFLKALGENLEVDPDLIEFVGRQVVVGASNRLDLLYYYDEFDQGLHDRGDPDYFIRHFIIVELKAREITLEDLSQVSRYIDAIRSCTAQTDGVFENDAIGVLVGSGISHGLYYAYATEVLNEKKISILDVETECSFLGWNKEIGLTNVDSIDKRLEEVFMTEPDGFISDEEFERISEEMNKRKKEHEHDRVSETPQET